MSVAPAPGEHANRSKATVEANDDRVVEMRTAGKSFATIARAVGLDSARDALAAFNRGIRSRPAKELATLRKAELKRLDTLAKRVKARAELGADDIAVRLKRVERIRVELLAD